MGLIGRGLAVDIDALVTLSRIGSKLAQIGCSANPRQFTSIGHGLAIFANPCPIPIELDWMIAFEFKNSGVLYIWVFSGLLISRVFSGLKIKALVVLVLATMATPAKGLCPQFCQV